MRGRAVGVAVVCHQPLDRDAVGTVEADGAAQEADRRDRPFIAQDLDVGKAGGVVDADVDELPATAAGRVPAAGVGAVTEAALDRAQLLDVDVDQLARSGALIAVRRLGRLEPAELAQADSGQDP